MANKKDELSGPKRRPTEPFTPGSGLYVPEPKPLDPNELTTQQPAYNDDATRETSAISDDMLGPGRLDAGRSEPSEPNAVIGPITKRRARTSPYQDSNELKLKHGSSSKPGQLPKKKSLARRIIKGVLWTLAILLLLVGAAIGFFHTGPGKSVARGIVEDALGKRYDGKVTLGELDYALGGDVELRDLVIAQKDGREVVNLKHLLVDLDWGSLMSKPLTIEKLAINGVKLDLVQFPDGTNNLNRMQKEPTKLPEQIVVQALEVNGVNLQIENPAGQKMTISDLAVAASLALDNPAGKLDLTLTNLSGKLDNPKLTADFALAAKAHREGANIEATLEPKKITVVRKGPDGKPLDPIDVAIKPFVVSTKDGVAHLTFGGLAAGPLTVAGLEVKARMPDKGAMIPTGDLLFALTGVKVDKAGVNLLLGREVLISDIGLDLSAKGPAEALALDGKVKTDGGLLSLAGTANIKDPLNPILKLVLTGDNLDTTKILAPQTIDGQTQQTNIQTSFKATIDSQGLPPNQVLAVHVDVGKTDVSGRSIDSVVIDFSGKGQVLTLDGLTLTAFGQELKLDGEFDRDSREFRGHVGMQTVLADAIQRAKDAGVLVAPLPPISGKLDVDLGVQGRLKPVVPPGVEAPPATPFNPQALLVNGHLDFSTLPVEVLTIKGKITGEDVVVRAPPGSGLPDRSVGKVDAQVDMKVEGGKPDGLTGQLVAQVGMLDTGKQTLDEGEVKVVFDGLTQEFTIKAKDEKQALLVDVAMKSVLDIDKRHVDATLTKLDLERGPAKTRLEAPVTIAIDSALDGKQSIVIPPVQLELAGGTLGLGVQAKLSPDAANPGANKVDYFDVSLDLESIDIGRLAGLARRSTKGLSGKIDASVRAQGALDNPQASFFGTLRGRMKGGDPFSAKFDGALRDKKVDLALDVTDRQGKLLTADIMAPVNLKPAGLGAGRFSIKADLPTTTLSRLGALMPNGLPLGVDPDGELAFGMQLSGTTQRPTGQWHFDFEGDMLRRRGYEQAPAKQKVAIAGTMTPEGDVVVVHNDFDLHLDSASAATVAHHTHATFERSPLLKGFMAKPWTLVAGLEQPLDLSIVTRYGLSRQKIQGLLATSANLQGGGTDVLGTLELGLNDVRVGTAPVANIKGLVDIQPDAINVSQRIAAAGLDALALDLKVGVGGKGLLASIKDRPRLMRAPLSGEVRLVEHAIAEWKTALGELGKKLPALPGNVGGAIVLGGNLSAPTANGALAWDGFQTVSGAPGRVAFELDASKQRAEGGLAIGAQREVTIRGGVNPADLMDPAKAKLPLTVDVAMKADHVDLMTLVPAFATAGKPFKVKGALDWSMAGKVHLSRDPEKPGFAEGSHLLGDLVIADLDVEVPDTDRHLRDGRVAFRATQEALEIVGIEVREGRFPNMPGLNIPVTVAADKGGDRTVMITGRVPWKDLAISDASLSIATHDFLLPGKGFDTPEGEIDIDMKIEARDLMAPVKSIDVTIAALHLNSPDRFVRAHYPQFPAYDDVIYSDVTGHGAGWLPPGVGTPPPQPVPDAVAPTLTPPATTGLDIKLRMPNPIHLVLPAPSPLNLKLKGAMDVAMRGTDMQLHGQIDVVEGVLEAMGRPFDLVSGVITANGGLDTVKADIVFATRPHDIALRDVAAGKHGDVSTITVRFSQKTGQQTIFGGVSGPYLLDMATFLNTGRARIWGLPDVPASETIRFGNPDQGLVVTFIQTNLRNLIFMDRMNGWSESLEEPSEYGRLRFFDMQRFVADGGARIHFEANPVEIGQNRMQLGYDWLMVNEPNTVFGFGPHLGIDLRAGLGFTLDWSSKD